LWNKSTKKEGIPHSPFLAKPEIWRLRLHVAGLARVPRGFYGSCNLIIPFFASQEQALQNLGQ
jgi:hypothetical protein